MTDSEKTGHYAILNSLYELYQANQTNPATLSAVADIAWNLGVNLNLDYGYHELAELARGTKAGSTEGSQHYIEVIESNLKTLKP